MCRTAFGAGALAAARRRVRSTASLQANQVADPDALLALRVNGADLSLDHGYPARIIVPALPGVHNTKWVPPSNSARPPMRKALTRISAIYGAHPLHLLTMLAGFALLGYTWSPAPAALWNPALVAVDAGLVRRRRRRPRPGALPALRARRPLGLALLRPRRQAGSPGAAGAAANYIRVPALGSGLTLLMFLPGIIEQGAPAYAAATGQTQQPFLGRWLLLTAALFAVSAVVYTLRLCHAGGPCPRARR